MEMLERITARENLNNSKTGVRATVHAKSKGKLEKKVRENTRRSDGKGCAWKKKKLKETVTASSSWQT